MMPAAWIRSRPTAFGATTASGLAIAAIAATAAHGRGPSRTPVAVAAAAVAPVAAPVVPVAAAGPAGPFVPPAPELPCQPVEGSTAEAILSRYYVADGCGVAGRGDLTRDGRDDCWSATYFGGSGFGGWNVAVDPSCTGDWQTIDDGTSFSEMAQAIPIPRAASNEHLRAWIVLLWGPAENALAPGPALEWLLDEARGRVADPPRTSFTARWYPGAPATSLRGQTLLVAGRPADDLVRALSEHEESPTGRAFVRGAGQRPLAEAARCVRYAVYRSEHGVAVRDLKTDRWAWIYLWTGIDKLRHAGIGEVGCLDGVDVVVVAIRGEGGEQLVAFSPSTGQFAAVTGAERPYATWRVRPDGVRIDRELVTTRSLLDLLASR